MTSRLLVPSEWRVRLTGTELEAAAALLDPETTEVLAVEHDGQLVACWALIRQYHVEGLWIHPDHRGRAGVARRLWALLVQRARVHGVRTVCTAACSAVVRTLLAHRGAVKLDGDHFAMRVR